jgi:DNA polymerase
MTADELADYHANERINDRGVLVDVPLAQAAQRYAVQELDAIQERVREVTQGAITSVRSPRMREWVYARLGPQAKRLMDTEEGKQSIDKAVRANLLALDDPEQVPPEVAEVIQAADDLWASSVAKFKRLEQLADKEDHRVRGAFVFAGGSATGRASSYGAQVHNFTRKCCDDPAAVRRAMVRGHDLVPAYARRVTDVLRGMLRPALIPAPGHVFVVGDYSQIEARMNPWLSCHATAEAVLDVFRQGRDIYVREAAGIFHKPEGEVGDDERQIGKVAILACGFGGGLGAFTAMGKVYGLQLPESDARRTVDAWRRANPWAVDFWQKLEWAYTRAMHRKGEVFTAGRIQYMFDGTHLWYALPSGRVLCYPFARLEDDGISYAKASFKPAADATEWPRARLWRGLACENVTQAAAHDVLRFALRQLEGVVMHVHDEIVVECREADAEATLARVREVMCTAPQWAPGLPVSSKPKTMLRYGK